MHSQAQKRLWLGVARQALADWHADEKNFLGGFSVKRLLTTGTTDEMTYILAQALKPWCTLCARGGDSRCFGRGGGGGRDSGRHVRVHSVVVRV